MSSRKPYCVWASQTEKKTARGGQAGDQTGSEVRKGQWYYFGQGLIIRPKNSSIADKIADQAEKAASNNHIGYDQDSRTTLYYAVEGTWDCSKVTKNVETDCSALTATCINCAYKKKLINPNAYTGNLRKCCEDTGEFTIIKQGNSYKGLKRGDIILAEGKHVIICVQDSEYSAGKSYSGTFPSTTLKKGSKGSQVKYLQTFLNWYGGYGLVVDGEFGSATESAVKKFQTANGLTVDGIFGAKSLAKAKTVTK